MLSVRTVTRVREVWHTPRQLESLHTVDLFSLVLQYQSMDMRDLVLRKAPTDTDPDSHTFFKVCELAILYEDHKLLEDLLQRYDVHRTHTLTKRLKDVSSALDVKSCTDILSACLTFDVVLPTTSSSIVLTLLTAVMRSNDSSVHCKIKPPSNFILLIVPRRYFCCGSNCFVYWSRIVVLFEPYVRFHIFSSVRAQGGVL